MFIYISGIEGLTMKYLLIFIISLFSISCTNDPEQKTTTSKNELKEISGKVFEYGIYDAQRKGRLRTNIATNTGKILTRPVLTLSKETDRIPLLKNTYFAYRFRLLDLPKEETIKPTVNIRKVLIHPEMTLPDGSISTGWDRVVRARTSISQVIAFDGYAFNEDYELVEGDWIFQIWFKDTKLVEQKFKTYHSDKSTIKKAAMMKADSNSIKMGRTSTESENKI